MSADTARPGPDSPETKRSGRGRWWLPIALLGVSAVFFFIVPLRNVLSAFTIWTTQDPGAMYQLGGVVDLWLASVKYLVPPALGAVFAATGRWLVPTVVAAVVVYGWGLLAAAVWGVEVIL